MFEWFKEISDKAYGVDVEAVKAEKEIQRKEARKNRRIFSPKAKTWIIVLAILYIVFTLVSIVFIGAEDMILYKMKSVLMIIVALFIIITLLIGKKTGELLALIGIFVFLFGLYLSLSIY